MRRIKLCDICDFQGGSQPPKNQWIDSPQYGYIRMLQIRDFTQSEKVKPEYIKITSSSKVCNEDDILIARNGASVGKILTGLAGAYNVAIMKTIPDEEKISKRFLFHFLSSQYFQNYIMNVGSRAAQAGFNKDDLQGISLKEYSLKEQADICSILDEINVIIKKRKKQLKYIENVVKSRFIEMFGDPVVNQNNLPVVKLGDLSELITKGASPSWQGFTYTKDNSQTLFITSENVREGYIDLLSPKYIENGFNEKQKRSIIKKGDFLINIVGASIGRAAQFQLECKANMNQAAALVRINDARVRDKYLLIYLNSDGAKLMYDSMKSDTGRANLSLQDVSDLLILLPSIQKQIEFEEFVNQTDKSKYYNFTSYKYCVLAANLIRQEWMLCQTLSF